MDSASVKKGDEECPQALKRIECKLFTSELKLRPPKELSLASLYQIDTQETPNRRTALGVHFALPKKRPIRIRPSSMRSIEVA